MGHRVGRGDAVKVDVEPTRILPEVLMIRSEVFRDDRGAFREVFRQDTFEAAGLPADFVQLNQSTSKEGVIRGLHFQWSPPMGKLMRVTRGRAFVVAADVRRGSPTLGTWVGRELHADDELQMWAPAGFARGFCALEGPTDVEYLCTATYRGEGEGGVRWDDPEIGVAWPVRDPILSERDRTAPSLAEWLETSASDFLEFGRSEPEGSAGP